MILIPESTKWTHVPEIQPDLLRLPTSVLARYKRKPDASNVSPRVKFRMNTLCKKKAQQSGENKKVRYEQICVTPVVHAQEKSKGIACRFWVVCSVQCAIAPPHRCRCRSRCIWAWSTLSRPVKHHHAARASVRTSKPIVRDESREVSCQGHTSEGVFIRPLAPRYYAVALSIDHAIS
ncbi:hypothetical protein Micbo1qcDRAFT_156316 [Microdochium bolleyi]|uniref:Uncharacterized protein n=1 Tax=Microdochium bolleyi TaxID=196109 RepID=A0A136JJW9_9PEZI|nr:hypothetical protein Micbo1qcDRAFT_156316 [Microdochium bolleyi]